MSSMIIGQFSMSTAGQPVRLPLEVGC